MQSFCSAYRYVTDLERRVISEEKYREFAEIFGYVNGTPWSEQRYELDFVQNDVVEVLPGTGFIIRKLLNWYKETNALYYNQHLSPPLMKQ